MGKPAMLQQLAKCSGMSLPTKDETNAQIWKVEWIGCNQYPSEQNTSHREGNNSMMMK